jgi:Fic family protein
MTVDENIFLAKKILVGNVYNAAKLEGVNTTFPETEAILGGVNVAGAKLDDIQTILNLRDAWRDMLATINTAEIDLKFIKQINANVSRNESLAWGELRAGKISIAGTNHKPSVPDEKTTLEAITKILSDKTKSATERAIDLMLYIMYNQLFWDGNKRTATLAANAVLTQNGAGVLSVAENDIVEFNRLLKQYYDTSQNAELKQFLYDKSIIDFNGH